MSITPSKATKKPIEIEIVQYNPGEYTKGEWLDWCPGANIGVRGGSTYEEGLESTSFVWFTLPTLEGGLEVVPTSWVAKGVKGEFYPIRDDIFRETYDLGDG